MWSSLLITVNKQEEGAKGGRDTEAKFDESETQEGDNDPAWTKGGRDTEVKFDESETQEAHNDPESDDLLGEAIWKVILRWFKFSYMRVFMKHDAASPQEMSPNDSWFVFINQS